MTDTVTEFINTTGLTLPALQAGVTVVSNTATETAVVKDISAACSGLPRPLSLNVGPANVANFVGATLLSGTELIGANTALTLKTSSQALYSSFYSSANQTLYQSTVNTAFSSDVLTNGAIAVPSSPAPAALSSNMSFIFFDQSGNFFYCDQGNSRLYRRNGGVNGAETTITFGTMAVAYDGVRYIYGFDSTYVYTYDTVNKTVSSVAHGLPAVAGGYCSCGALDGRIYFRNGQYGGYGYWVNPVTGLSYVVHTGVSISVQYPSGLAKDASGNYIAWATNGGTIYWWNLGTDIVNPAVRSNGNFTTSGFIVGSSNTNQGVRVNGNTDLSRIYFINGTLWVVDFNLMTITNISFTGASWGNTLCIPAPDPSKAAIDFGTVSIRATGIKTT